MIILSALYSTFARQQRVTNGKPFEVGIIGAGLGGLALAQSLVRLGIDVRVYERDTSPATRSQGYRITLDKRGIRALEACLPSNLWGLFQATLGEPGGFFRFVTGDLREIFHLDFAVKPGTDINYVASQADRTTLREIRSSRQISLIGFPSAK